MAGKCGIMNRARQKFAHHGGKNMILLGKIKEGAKGILKEHPASVVTFFLSFLFLGILSYDYKFKY
ncbi:MAG: hypothetical protein II842_16350, partial [Butyrivibrio sp.]|nr:hypothetical protein [Butyrivibrio sp.]